MATEGKIKVGKISGINNVDSEEDLSKEEMRVIENLDITDRGGVKSRKGFVQLVAGSFRSLGGNDNVCLVATGDELHIVAEDALSTSAVRAGMDANRDVSYATRANEVYYSNGETSGVVVAGADAPWAVPTPNQLGSLSSGVGGLQPGVYHIAITHVDSSGRESGAAHVGKFELAVQGGINISGLDSSAYATNVYATTRSGETFYLYEQLAPGVTGVLVVDIAAGKVMQTQDLTPLPAGDIINVFKGRLLSAKDNVLWYEEAFTSGLCRAAKNFIFFREEITMVAAVENGVYVSADALYFLEGKNPNEWKPEYKGDMKAVRGTDEIAPGSEFKREGVDRQSDVVLFTTNKGVYIGYDDGTIVNLTEDAYSFSVGDRGAGLFRREDGVSHYLSSLKEPNDGKESMAMTDNVVAEVYRNGILIT